MKFIFCVIVISLLFQNVYARELKPIDAILVLDVSRSMITADPYRIANTAMNMFIDKLEPGRDRVGIVAYAGHITYSRGLTELDANSIADLHSTIYALEYASWTDHPLGLLEALDILYDGQEEGRQPVIIFLTDGNLNVSPHGVRTTADAEYDKERIIEKSQYRGIPIFTIGLNFDGLLDRRYTEIVADETGGIAFETHHAEDLPQILDDIFVLMQYILPTFTYEPAIEYEIYEPDYEPAYLPIYEDDGEDEPPPTNRTAIVASAAGLVLLALLLLKARKPRRVFTGNLAVQAIGIGETREREPVHHRLIEYGSRTTMQILLDKSGMGAVPQVLGRVVLMPSSTAPSHLPELVFTGHKKRVKFTKNFMAQEARGRVSVTSGTELVIEAEGENTKIRVWYS